MDTGYTPTLQNDSLTNSTKVYLLSILGIRSTYQKRSILRNGEGKKKKKRRKILYTHTSGEAQDASHGMSSVSGLCSILLGAFLFCSKTNLFQFFFFLFFFGFQSAKKKKKMREKALEAKSGIFLCLCH